MMARSFRRELPWPTPPVCRRTEGARARCVAGRARRRHTIPAVRPSRDTSPSSRPRPSEARPAPERSVALRVHKSADAEPAVPEMSVDAASLGIRDRAVGRARLCRFGVGLRDDARRAHRLHADCADGNWQGDRWSGKVTAGTRYRYRALKPHNEVIFWTVGTSEPSGKFDNCKIKERRNWVSKGQRADAPRSIDLQMVHGKADGRRRRRRGRSARSPNGAGCCSAWFERRCCRRAAATRRPGGAADAGARDQLGAAAAQRRRRRPRSRRRRAGSRTAPRSRARESSPPGSPAARRSRGRRSRAIAL